MYTFTSSLFFFFFGANELNGSMYLRTCTHTQAVCNTTHIARGGRAGSWGKTKNNKIIKKTRCTMKIKSGRRERSLYSFKVRRRRRRRRIRPKTNLICSMSMLIRQQETVIIINPSSLSTRNRGFSRMYMVRIRPTYKKRHFRDKAATREIKTNRNR